ncbi:MAG: LytTR family transcriptional regulator [Butyrivibrio sp.]|nr:LytTR family transcriptional regulator [Butyrivibrio sp.]
MSDLLDIKLIIEKGWPKLTVTIKCSERNGDVDGIITAVQEYANNKVPAISVYKKDNLVMLSQKQIVRLYIEKRKVMVQTEDNLYETKKTLREVEEILDADKFVRISQSEIINIRKVVSFDFSFAGTIGVELKNGERTFVARRRVKYVKEALEKGDKDGYEN